MKNLNRLIVISVAMSSMLACKSGDSITNKYKKNIELSRQISLLTQKNGELTKALSQSNGKVNLKDLSKGDISPELKSSILGVDGYENLVVSVPVANHRDGIASSSEGSVVVMLPEGDEDSITTLKGVDAQGNEIDIPADQIPNFPVITVGRDEGLPAASVDGTIQASEAAPPIVLGPNDKALKLNTLSFTKAHEPWFKGSAEVYAIIAYMDKDGKGVTRTVEIEGADKANTLYSLDQIVHAWNDNKYQFVDIAFMEHDSNANYTDISNTALKASSGITTLIYPPAVPAVAIVADILGAVLKALPSQYFTDNDDYMDTVNLVEKNVNGDKIGVRGVMTISFTTYELLLNDGK